MTSAPGISPASRRCHSGRMSTSRASPASTSLGDLPSLEPFEPGAGVGQQLVDGAEARTRV